MASPTCDPAVHLQYLLRVGDSALVLAQRLSGWVGNAPTLEEEVALANLALDLLGQATLVLEHAAEVEGAGRDADALAYLRDAPDYHNLLLAELPIGDFAQTMVRQLAYEAYAAVLWRSLEGSADATLAAIAAKAVKETDYHLEHVARWIERLGGGTDESRRRVLDGIDEVWPYTGELFAADAVDAEVAAAGIAPSCETLRDAWRTTIAEAFDAADIPSPEDRFMQVGGKQGRHTEQLGFVLAEMQFLQRAYPGAVW